MKRAGLGMLLLVCALAGALLAVVVAGASPAAVFGTSSSATTTTGTTSTGTTATTTSTTTTSTTTTATTATTTAPPPPPPPPAPKPPKPTPKPKPPRLIAAAVTVGGVPVGGLTQTEAISTVRAAFALPLGLVFERHRLQPTPATLGATALVKQAVGRAMKAKARTRVTLAVRVKGSLVRAYVGRPAERWNRVPAASPPSLRALNPFVPRDVSGRVFDRGGATAAIVSALVRNRRSSVVL